MRLKRLEKESESRGTELAGGFARIRSQKRRMDRTDWFGMNRISLEHYRLVRDRGYFSNCSTVAIYMKLVAVVLQQRNVLQNFTRKFPETFGAKV